MVKINGFLASRNLLSQGYPFLEAIYSFLNWGSKLYILDAGSTDGTSEILNELSNKRIILMNDGKWNATENNKLKGRAIGDLYTQLLKRILKLEENNKSYLFELQANEIAHEGSWEELKQLPDLIFGCKGYMLPYRLFSGFYQYGFSWRLRMARLNGDIDVPGDAGALRLRNTLRFRDYIGMIGALTRNFLKDRTTGGRAIFSFNYNRIYTANMEHPLFRYSFLFPDSIKKKAENHVKIFGNRNWSGNWWKDINKIRSKNPSKFYKRLADHLISSDNIKDHLNERVLKSAIDFSTSKHPKIMQQILKYSSYRVRPELITAIKRL